MTDPIKDSIRHWEENVERAKAGTLEYADITGTRCALCREYGCDECPLANAGYQCDFPDSPWRAVKEELHALKPKPDKLVRACERMLEVLKSLEE